MHIYYSYNIWLKFCTLPHDVSLLMKQDTLQYPQEDDLHGKNSNIESACKSIGQETG